MNFLHNIALGFSVALTPLNFLYCFVGATLGTLVGVLPGLGPVTTIAMLLPLTFKMPAIASLIMLAGIYYGAHHAGSTTAIMLNMPGEPTSVVICFDGHPMARQGRAGPALFIAAIASFFAGCVGIVVIALFSPFLATAALHFAGPEYTSMLLLALLATAILSRGSLITTVSMVGLGLLLGSVGTDINSGLPRFTFGTDGLANGISFVTLAVGLFAVSQIAWELGQPARKPMESVTIRSLLPTRADLLASWRPILRGTGLGACFGAMPGTGPLISSFASYNLERQLAAEPQRFGRGAIEGVAGPEAANNAAALTHFVPMLTLGIPAGAAMALMLGAMTIQGITPGPQVIQDHPDLYWGVIASMWIGNLMLLVLNLPLVGIWIKLLTLPYRLLYPAVLVFCCVGVYSVNNSYFDVLLAALFGFVGYILRKLGCSPSPLMFGFIIGPLLEENLRRAMLIANGDFTVFLRRPISLGFLLATLAFLLAYCSPAFRRSRDTLVSEEH